jgi:hypothetical protein
VGRSIAVRIGSLVLGGTALALALRIVILRLRAIGLVSKPWKRDALLGCLIAISFALVQFLIIIPNTGGASRSDVIANVAQIGDSVWGGLGFVVTLPVTRTEAALSA